jgi:uncharacterized protein
VPEDGAPGRTTGRGGGLGIFSRMPMGGSLADTLASCASVLVAYSGGVDSALLAVTARRMLGRDRAVAALGVSPSLSAEQHEQARAIARQFDLELVEVLTDELGDPGYVANAPSRCYFCKRELWRRLATVAAERGLAVVVDGTNADDLHEHRPGLRASREQGVRSPLAEAGLTKADVRGAARALGLPNWDAPAAPCLASRVTYGLAVTPDRLAQIEAAETYLRSLGVRGDLRVRHRGDEARIEAHPSALAMIRRSRTRVTERLHALGFARITLDLEGYRRGRLVRSDGARVEILATRA